LISKARITIKSRQRKCSAVKVNVSVNVEESFTESETEAFSEDSKDKKP
jgi:uncharacterized metal-binding protein YceD (DUF177 family)